MTKPVESFGDIALFLDRGDATIQRLAVGCLFAHRREQRFVLAKGIEQGQLLSAVKQGLVFVLAVDFQQVLGQFRQLRGRGGATVDPGARPAIGAQGAPQLAVRAVVQFLETQPGEGRSLGQEAELRCDFGAFRPVSHHAGIGARATQQEQRIHQQGLAGSGFTRDHGQPRAESDFDLADDREILDVERNQHAGRVGGSNGLGARN